MAIICIIRSSASVGFTTDHVDEVDAAGVAALAAVAELLGAAVDGVTELGFATGLFSLSEATTGRILACRP